MHYRRRKSLVDGRSLSTDLADEQSTSIVFRRMGEIAKSGDEFWGIEKEYLPVEVLKRKKTTILEKQIQREKDKKGATNPYIYASLEPDFKVKASAVQAKYVQH